MAREVSSITCVGTSEPSELQTSRSNHSNALSASFNGVLVDNGDNL